MKETALARRLKKKNCRFQPEAFDIVVVMCAVEATDDIDEFVESGNSVVGPRCRVFYQRMTEPTIGPNVIGFDQRYRAATWRLHANSSVSCYYATVIENTRIQRQNNILLCHDR
jgi:hypothetical protein